MTDLASIEVAGSVAVVTGGANGIGRGIVRALLEADATVVVADVEQAVLDTTVATLSASHPGRITGVVTDVTDDASTDVLADQVFNTHGRCNLLFNNAGIAATHPVEDVMAVNWLGLRQLSEGLLPQIVKDGAATGNSPYYLYIIFICSFNFGFFF